MASEEGGEHSVGCQVPDPDVSRVAKEFTRLYYHILNENPEFLHQFYGLTSKVTVSETQDDGSNLTVRADTLELIKNLTLKMFADVRVALTNCTPQASLGDSVQLMVSGVMQQKNSEEERLFTQALVLAKQDRGYFVLNDTVHVHSRLNSSKVLNYTPAEVADTPQEATKEVPTPPQEPEMKPIESEETEQPVMKEVVLEDSVDSTPVAQEVEVSRVPDVSSADVSPPVVKKPSPGMVVIKHNREDEPVGPPTKQNVAPIEKPIPTTSKPRSYIDALKASGR